MMTISISWAVILAAFPTASCFQSDTMMAGVRVPVHVTLGGRRSRTAAAAGSHDSALCGTGISVLCSTSLLHLSGIPDFTKTRRPKRMPGPSPPSVFSIRKLFASSTILQAHSGGQDTLGSGSESGSSDGSSRPAISKSNDGTSRGAAGAASTSVTQTNDDNGFAVTYTTTRIESISSVKAKRRKQSSAPLVDSTLLRFLSVQKKQIPDDSITSDLPQFAASRPNSPENLLRKYGIPQNVLSTSNDTLSEVTSSVKADAIAKDIADFLAREERATQLAKSESNISNETISGDLSGNISGAMADAEAAESVDRQDVVVTPSVDPWMGQYNRNRIAQTLVSHEADEKVAQMAGEKVQELVLIRTARRRVRSFLRERDSFWSAQRGVEDAQDNSTALRNEDLAHPEYGFDDVMEVLLEYGLTGRDISTILTHSPSVALMMPRRIMKTASDAPSGGADAGDASKQDSYAAVATSGETLEETLNRAFRGLLMTTLNLSRAEARRVLRFCPGLLSMRGSKSAVQVMAMLTKIGVTTKSVTKDKKNLPSLLSRSPAALFRLVAFLSSDAVRMPVRDIGPLLRRAESREMLDAVAPIPRVDALNMRGIPRNDEVSSASSAILDDDASKVDDPMVASALWGRDKEVRRQRVDEVFRNMTETAWTLRNEIGTKDLGKVVNTYPSVLMLDADKQILPVASYLMEELGILEGDLPRVLQLYPKLLAQNMTYMQQVESFFISIGVQEENLPSVFRAFPTLLTADIGSMQIVVEFLRKIGVDDVGRFVTRLPPVLCYSLENELIPKWRLLKSVNKFARFELLRFPAYFSYPYEKVIKTRYLYLMYKGLPTDFAIDAVVRYGDTDFATLIAGDFDEGKRYRAFLDARRQTAKQNTQAQRATRRRQNSQQSEKQEQKPEESQQ